jgi:CRP-like cAMP-binding protein
VYCFCVRSLYAVVLLHQHDFHHGWLGDVLPENNFERFATVGLMYIGVLVFALLLTEIQDAIGEAFLYQREVARALARTRDFLIEHEIPAELCSRVLRWLEFDYPIRQHWQRQKEALDHVPMVLRRLLFSHMHRDILYKVPFLVDIQSFHKDEFLVDLYSRFQPMTMPGNMPFSLPGRMADGLHYIVKGSVHAEIEGRLVSSLNPGDIFGSDLVLFDEEQRQEFGHFFNLAGMPCEIYSDSHVHCLCLTASDFEDAVRSYPRELRGEIEICKAFLGKRMRKTWETITNMGATEMIMHARWWVLLQKIGRHRREVPRTHFDIFGKRNMSQLSESKLFDPSKLRNYAERMKFSVTGGWNSHSWYASLFFFALQTIPLSLALALPVGPSARSCSLHFPLSDSLFLGKGVARRQMKCALARSQTTQ